MGVGRLGFTAAVLSTGKVLVAGGLGVATAELYDPNTGVFTSAGTMSVPRALADGVDVSKAGVGEIVVIPGGLDTIGNTRLSSVEYYRVSSNDWVSASSLPVARSSHRSVAVSGKVLVAGGTTGGISGLGPPPQALASAVLYDPDADLWSAAGTMFLARGGDHSLTTLSPTQVLVAGGQAFAPDPYTAAAEIYTYPGSTWAPVGSMVTARGAHRAVILGYVLMATI
jgi:hypothetical protein